MLTRTRFRVVRLLALLIVNSGVRAAAPRDAVPLDTAALPASYRLHVEFSAPVGGTVRLGQALAVPLSKGVTHDLAVEQPARGAPVLRVWSGAKLVRGPEEIPALAPNGAQDFPGVKLDLGADFTAVARFETRGGGTLLARCAPQGKWAPDAKALFIRDGRLVYDIGWLGALSGGGRVDDGGPHTVVLVVQEGIAQLWLDGKRVARREKFTRPDPPDHVFKIGRAATDFAGDFAPGKLATIQVWSRALPEAEVLQLFKENVAAASTPDFVHTPDGGAGRPVIEPAPGATVVSAWVQPLEKSDHAELVSGWNAKTLEEGREIYNSLCIVCHGTKDQPGSLPTALRFAEAPFKNGSDPYSMYVTLTRGFGQMVPQGQYTTAQKYSVIQYIRETFIRPSNPGQLAPITPAYLAALPKGLTRAEAEKEDRTPPPYERMDFGPALMWTLQIAPGNIAQKGIAIRLDAGPGGVSKGRAWMVYDHDTLRLAAATTGDFVDWKGIAFDGSHGTHTSLTGDRHFLNPNGPGWASPDGRWDDQRLIGKDGQPYGPLPRDWARYEGIYVHGGQVVLAVNIAGTRVLESPAWLDYGTTPVFIRTLNVAPSTKPLRLRVAPDSVNVVLAGDGALRREEGFWVADLPPGPGRARLFISRADGPSLAALVSSFKAPLNLEPLTKGGPARWPQEIRTTSEAGPTGGAFLADTFPLPLENPWESWMRPGGFDFTPDGRAAIVATWNGDVWRVDGLMAPAPAPLRWRRIASGLFQPLGVKFRGEDLFIACRDQIVRLRDLNGDGEADFLENFNNDHQVTEHFHEFAMGLQTDAAGNFYYAKSGRHALDSVVPHHGTLLRVSADGARTDILATGFRAANGVCLNDDGTFFVTDQEGFWTPKNRINRVKPGGFYGNMFGYTAVTNTSDDAMEPPMVWITNEKDRSPAELLWVPKNVWGSLGGALLNLSYGIGRAFIVPNEEVGGRWQGAVCEFPMPAFATGIMRGRFAPDGALYTCGMFAWAGNATSPGGFHRIRRGPAPAWVPLAVRAATGALSVTFSDPLDPAGVVPAAFTFKAWSLKRSANYGSKHYDEHLVPIQAARLGADARTVTLEIPALAPTHCYELKATLRGADGATVERSLHGTIHQLLFGALAGDANAAPPPTGRAAIPDKVVVLTFDDSVRSHYTVARPLLKELGFGATFFITEGFDFKTNKVDYMTWDEIRQLHEDGFEIGNHTRDHLGITLSTLPRLREQLDAINQRCQEHRIPRPVSLAYPGNAFHRDALPILESMGIRYARRGGSPEYTYEEGGGVAFEPGRDHPLLIPSAGDARPNWTLADLVKALGRARPGTIPVLQFHGVPDRAHPWVNTPTERFREYMAHLKTNAYTVLALRDLDRFIGPEATPKDPQAVIDERIRQRQRQAPGR